MAIPPPHMHTHITITQVIFVMTPGIQEREHQLLDMFLSHPLAGDQFSRALMKSYIGISSYHYYHMLGSQNNYKLHVHVALYVLPRWCHLQSLVP